MKEFLFFLILFFSTKGLISQEYSGKEAEKFYKDAQKVYLSKESNFPTYILFKNNKSYTVNSLLQEWRKNYNLDARLIRIEKDNLNQTHYVYQQYVENFSVEFAIFKLHEKNNKVISFSGYIYTDVEIKEFKPIISFMEALAIAKQQHNAEKICMGRQRRRKSIKTNF